MATMQMLTTGQKVLWLWETNRGYGYRQWVPAVVVKVGRKRVTIEVEKTRGGTKQVTVTPGRLATDRTGMIACRLRLGIYRDEAEVRENYTDLTESEWQSVLAQMTEGG